MRASTVRPVALEELPKLHEQLGGQSPAHVLKWAAKRFGNKLGMTTAFGYSGIVLMHHLRKLGVDILIYFIDTGFHFPETLELRDRLRKDWKLKIRTVGVDDTLRKYVFDQFGPRPWKRNPNICCNYFKVDPLLRILPRKTAWLSGLRREQSYSRGDRAVVEIDGRGTFKVAPLVDWSRKQAWAYIREHELPYNPLHDEHYPSVGCTHCTVPVEKGADERDGRWQSSPKLECGIHI